MKNPPSSFFFSHDDLLKILGKNNTFKTEIETSFNKEVAEKLRFNNLSITKTFNQRFPSFQKLMLKTIEEVVVQMISTTHNNKCNPRPSKMLFLHKNNYLPLISLCKTLCKRNSNQTHTTICTIPITLNKIHFLPVNNMHHQPIIHHIHLNHLYYSD